MNPKYYYLYIYLYRQSPERDKEIHYKATSVATLLSKAEGYPLGNFNEKMWQISNTPINWNEEDQGEITIIGE